MMDLENKAVNTDSASVEQNTENKDITVAETNQNVIPTLGETLGNGEVPQFPPGYNSYSLKAKLAIQNALMLMEGKNGGGFFVKFIQDAGTAYGWLNLIIVYPDGDCHIVQLYKNYFRETDTESSNGVWKPSGNKGNQEVKGYARVNWDGPPNAENYDSMEQYTTPQMPIPAKEIWKKILENKEQIPIEKINQTASVEQLLADMKEWAESASKEYEKGFINGDTAWYISTDAFKEIVEANGCNLSRVRTEFDVLHLFIKDNVAHSYQKSKRINGKVERFYAVRKSIPEATTPPKMLEDVKFIHNYQTKEEKEIKRLERQLDDYDKKYNELAAKIGEPPIRF